MVFSNSKATKNVSKITRLQPRREPNRYIIPREFHFYVRIHVILHQADNGFGRTFASIMSGILNR